MNQLPPNASHQVGVGALVLNEEGDVLVVREKHGGPYRNAEFDSFFAWSH